MKPPTICLIGGSGRSGTTILRRIFDRHPDVATIPEFRITLDPGGLLDFYINCREQWSPYLYSEKLDALEKVLRAAAGGSRAAKYYRLALRKCGLANVGIKLDKRYTGVDISQHYPGYQQLVEELIRELTDFTYRGTWTGQTLGERARIRFKPPPDTDWLADRLATFYLGMATRICENRRATHFIEDNTWNILYFSDFLEFVPEARLVHIHRDPRDVVASYTRQAWTPLDAIESACFYKGVMDRWHAVRQRLPSSSFLEVALEDLVDNPQTVLNDIVSFWNLPWDDTLLEVDLSKSNAGRWKRDIPQSQQVEVERVLDPYLKRYGRG